MYFHLQLQNNVEYSFPEFYIAQGSAYFEFFCECYKEQSEKFLELEKCSYK